MEVLDAAALAPGTGEARWWFGTLAEIKATAASTGGQFTLVEVTESPNNQGMRHIHHNEDEAFWVLEGSMNLEVGGEHTELGVGDYAFGPRDIPHSYKTGPDGCRVLFLLTPGGFEGLIMATSVPAETRTVPPPSGEMPDIAKMQEIVGRFGGEILV
ncbi:MAG: quercetin 2,3-dioxygenase [Candidatus Dormibacteria bacterium]